MTASGSRTYVSPHEVTAAWSAGAGDRVVRVVVDAAGGDNAPAEVVRGALQAAGPHIHVVLVGDEATRARAAAGRAPPTSRSSTPPT